jgi:hypothetical protein
MSVVLYEGGVTLCAAATCMHTQSLVNWLEEDADGKKERERVSESEKADEARSDTKEYSATTI